jgi:glycine cleavage system protein P-like pyridoxal-binding family
VYDKKSKMLLLEQEHLDPPQFMLSLQNNSQVLFCDTTKNVDDFSLHFKTVFSPLVLEKVLLVFPFSSVLNVKWLDSTIVPLASKILKLAEYPL